LLHASEDPVGKVIQSQEGQILAETGDLFLDRFIAVLFGYCRAGGEYDIAAVNAGVDIVNGHADKLELPMENRVQIAGSAATVRAEPRMHINETVLYAGQ
jgi:hypothetical protein